MAAAAGDSLAKVQASEVLAAPDKDALKVQLVQQALMQGSEAAHSCGAALQLCLQGIAPRPTINLQLLSGESCGHEGCSLHRLTSDTSAKGHACHSLG